jgi:hypothetical protein
MKHWKYYCPLLLNICVWQAFQPLKSCNPVTKAIAATAWLRYTLPGIKPRFEKLSKLLQSQGSHQQARHYLFVPFFLISHPLYRFKLASFYTLSLFLTPESRDKAIVLNCVAGQKSWVSDTGLVTPTSQQNNRFCLIPRCTAFRIWHSLTLTINSPFLCILTPMLARSHDTDDTDRMGPTLINVACICGIITAELGNNVTKGPEYVVSL